MVTPGESLALSIVQRLQAAGHIAYYAGGCVRDRLMGSHPQDFDVATSATPDEVLKLFPRSQKVGVAFGVVLVRERKGRGTDGGGMPHVEVATFRTDGSYADGRHPDAVHFTTPEHDAQRRDFTCNGLFFDPLANGGTGQLHDFVGGQKDIAARTLRAIGKAQVRFAEDHLRMVRAARFAARLTFGIEAETFAAMQALARNIQTISKERIHDELARILSHPSRAAAAGLLQDSRLLQYLWPPELLEKAEVARQWRALENLPGEADFVVALVAMHTDIVRCDEAAADHPGPATGAKSGRVAELLRRDFLLSNTESEDFAWLLERRGLLPRFQLLTKAEGKRVLADPRWPRLEMLYRTLIPDAGTIERFHERVAALQAEGVAPAPYVTGGVLIGLGVAPGPAFKGWLDELYDRQLENEFPNREAALDAARRLAGA